ncbi:MAG: sialidase family protein [Candidatus Thorarchaeota archaeon]
MTNQADASIVKTEIFFLAYAKESTHQPVVKYSEDGGVTWKSGKFPGFTVPTYFTGIGAFSSGFNYVVMIDDTEANKIRFCRGLGIDTWDTPASHYSVQGSVTPTSPPSGASVNKDLFLVVYRTTGNVIALQVYDIHQDKFISTSNWGSNVWGRPAIIYEDGTILMAWTGDGTLNTAVGSMAGDSPTFSSIQEVTIPYREGWGILSHGDPDITHNGTHYLMTVIRKHIEQTTYYSAFLFSSLDGVTWQEERRLGQTCPNGAHANIAATSDGTAFFADVDNHDGEITAMKYTSSGGWTAFDEASMFGVTVASYEDQFALVSLLMEEIHLDDDSGFELLFLTAPLALITVVMFRNHKRQIK